jgi:hypothetical protein
MIPAEDIVELILLKLANTPKVGTALEQLSNEEYDEVENDLNTIVGMTDREKYTEMFGRELVKISERKDEPTSFIMTKVGEWESCDIKELEKIIKDRTSPP